MNPDTAIEEILQNFVLGEDEDGNPAYLTDMEIIRLKLAIREMITEAKIKENRYWIDKGGMPIAHDFLSRIKDLERNNQ